MRYCVNISNRNLKENINMVGIYFSGTGNTKYCIKKFMQNYGENNEANIYSIEDINCINRIKSDKDIVLAYPIHYSDLPIIVKDFLNNNRSIFNNKNVFIICTMGLFSGDGTGCSARLLKKYGANILGGLHVKMPDCIGDVKLLKKTHEENKTVIKEAETKIEQALINIKEGKYPKEGLGFFYHIAGLFGQRLWFYNKTLKLRDKLKINKDKCISCGICSKNCPTDNIKMIDNTPVPQRDCTSCYRCISNCPKQAITLIGSEVYEQNKIEI